MGEQLLLFLVIKSTYFGDVQLRFFGDGNNFRPHSFTAVGKQDLFPALGAVVFLFLSFGGTVIRKLVLE